MAGGGKPLSPWLQKLNRNLHEEPVASIVYAVFWICALSFATPVAIVVLVVRLVVQLVWWNLEWTGADDYDPKVVNKSKNSKNKNNSDVEKELAVVVTGCDTGFGKEIALWAAEAGYVVFAGCLQEQSFEQFRLLSNVIPLKMDVTNGDDVVNAALQVKDWIDADKKKKRYLHALVNNAGIGEGFVADLTELSVYQKVMDVNFFGIVRCCKAFLPIFKEQSINGTYAGSRILNLTSLAGLNPGGAGAGNYAASKHAAQAFSQSLRAELAVFGIQVTTINPSFHSTPLVTGMADRMMEFFNDLPEDKRKEYGEDYFETVHKGMTNVVTALSWNVDVVADQTLRLLKARKTPPELVVGSDARFLFVIFRTLPAWVFDGISSLAPTLLQPAVLKNKGTTPPSES